jgi:putative ABC transport system substrate-binding protein
MPKSKEAARPGFTANLKQIASQAATSNLPSIYNVGDFAEAGGLVTYGPDRGDLFRRAAIYVDKFLKGAKPGDLPVEQPTKFELVINMKTANALGLKIPSSFWCTRPR